MERMPVLTDARQKAIRSRQPPVSPGTLTMMKAKKDDKLEFKWEEAWYNAVLELEDSVITVRYDGFEEIETWRVEAMQKVKPLCQLVRIASEQLQDEDCSLVKVNQAVCALSPIRSQGWYDATVVEVIGRLHLFEAGTETCTCSFTVLWRDGPDKGRRESNLQCGNICLHSRKDVTTHPLIRAILNDPMVEIDEEYPGTESSCDGPNRQAVPDREEGVPHSDLPNDVEYQAVEDHQATTSRCNDLNRQAAQDREKGVPNSDLRHDEECKAAEEYQAARTRLAAQDSGKRVPNSDLRHDQYKAVEEYQGARKRQSLLEEQRRRARSMYRRLVAEDCDN